MVYTSFNRTTAPPCVHSTVLTEAAGSTSKLIIIKKMQINQRLVVKPHTWVVSSEGHYTAAFRKTIAMHKVGRDRTLWVKRQRWCQGSKVSHVRLSLCLYSPAQRWRAVAHQATAPSLVQWSPDRSETSTWFWYPADSSPTLKQQESDSEQLKRWMEYWVIWRVKEPITFTITVVNGCIITKEQWGSKTADQRDSLKPHTHTTHKWIIRGGFSGVIGQTKVMSADLSVLKLLRLSLMHFGNLVSSETLQVERGHGLLLVYYYHYCSTCTSDSAAAPHMLWTQWCLQVFERPLLLPADSHTVDCC